MADLAGGSVFSSATVKVPDHDEQHNSADETSKLAFSRAYSIALSPQLIYTRSALLPTLVSSKVYRQLEFVAVGSWWIFEPSDQAPPQDHSLVGELRKIPGSREDIFGDTSIDRKDKRALMRFLKVVTDPEAQSELLLAFGNMPFDEFLTGQYAIPEKLQAALHALTLSAQPPCQTKTSYAIPRIFRHLASIGVFGPGFGSVVPKWGGLAEVAQVACRAGAVGGGVYVLGQGIEKYEQSDSIQASLPHQLHIQLRDKAAVRTSWLAGSSEDLPGANFKQQREKEPRIFRSISILSSSLSSLFPDIADGAPPPAGTVVVFPPKALGPSQLAPVYLVLHSSDTGECPAGQSVAYASIQSDSEADLLLDLAVQTLLRSVRDEPKPRVLWRLQYVQSVKDGTPDEAIDAALPNAASSHILPFSKATGDLAFDDSVLREVRTIWQRIVGKEEGFMQFEDREPGAYDEDDA